MNRSDKVELVEKRVHVFQHVRCLIGLVDVVSNFSDLQHSAHPCCLALFLRRHNSYFVLVLGYKIETEQELCLVVADSVCRLSG